jgi:hypothetical protein
MLATNLTGLKAFTFGAARVWPSVAAAASPNVSVSIPGLKKGDLVLIYKPTVQAGLGYDSLAVATLDNLLQVKFINPTAGNITPTANEVWTGIIFTSEPPSNSPLI